MFDEDAFLDNTTTEASSTEYVPVPEGEWQATVQKVGVRSGVSDNGEWAMLDVTWAIDDAEVTEATGLDNPTCRQSLFLERTEDGSGLAMGKGKNVQLGRLREAVGQNTSDAWSPRQLEGSVAIVKVEHRLYDGKTFADVKGASAV